VKPIEVLLAEDNPGDILLIRHALRAEPFNIHVCTAVDGEQAIQMLAEESFRPDLIIIDLNLPKLSGFSILERYRADIPIVVFSSSSNPAERQRSLDLGAKDFVQKPTDLSEFARAVSQMVRSWAPRQGDAGSVI
jgi:two-component system, chemotaxis family, response regulator Rcp1